MSIIDIIKQTQAEQEQVQSEKHKTKGEVAKPLSKTELIEIEFRKGAKEFWGEVSKFNILETRVSEGGTPYYLIVCEVKKGDKLRKLLQEWYISKEGLPKVNAKRVMAIDIELADEVAGMLFE